MKYVYLFGMVTFYTKESAPERLLQCVDTCKIAFTRVAIRCGFRVSVIFPRSAALKEIKLLYALGSKGEFPKADDAIAKQMAKFWKKEIKFWKKESGGRPIAYPETFEIKPLTEKSFISEMNTFFLYANPAERVAIKGDFRYLKSVSGEDLSVELLRVADTVLSYQPPAGADVPLERSIDDFLDGFPGEATDKYSWCRALLNIFTKYPGWQGKNNLSKGNRK